MLKLAIIGTNPVAQRVATIAHQTGQYQLFGVAAGTFEQAVTFGMQNNATDIFTSRHALLRNCQYDVLFVTADTARERNIGVDALAVGRAVLFDRAVFGLDTTASAVSATLAANPNARALVVAGGDRDGIMRALLQLAQPVPLPVRAVSAVELGANLERLAS